MPRANRFTVDGEQTLENITYARAQNSEACHPTPIEIALLIPVKHQHELLNLLSCTFSSNEYRLLIIDSIMALFRVDYSGRGELNERQQKLNQFLSKLCHMAEEFNVCVLMVSDPPGSIRVFHCSAAVTTVSQTNQVQSDPGASALFASADGRKPVGGHILAHASTTRLLLRKGRGEERVAKIQDSPGKMISHLEYAQWLRDFFFTIIDCPEREATYVITNGGINDPEKA